MPTTVKTESILFGPVPSRRLGRSLGVDIIPRKVCSLDCIYCEVGRTDKRALRRMEYVQASAILEELHAFLATDEKVDYITFSGSGEPTLNSKLGEILRAVKAITDIPLAVITNGTLLFLKEVRDDLQAADVVLPSLDAATQEVFERINRPHPKLNLSTIIEGMKQFRAEYAGQIWLEILLVSGVNDADDHLVLLKEVVKDLAPDRIQLNTVVRPPAESTARAVDERRLQEVRAMFGERCEVIGVYRPVQHEGRNVVHSSRILELLLRRPMTSDDLAIALNLSPQAVQYALDILEDEGLVIPVTHRSQKHYRTVQTSAN